jgi:sterol desaturase/sphingolipid hydroxylase (fatty acid hydroxylase superfamily)
MCILVSFVLSFVIPYFVHLFVKYVLSGKPIYNNETLLKKQEYNTPSLNVYTTCVLAAIATSIQGTFWICWGIYYGQISINQINVTPLWVITCITQVLFMLVIADITSYCFHRLSHVNRFIYLTFHKLHHENRLPDNALLSLQYGGIIDFLLSNMCYFTGFFVFKTDLVIIGIYGLVSTIITSFGHSGMYFYFFGKKVSSSFHAIHHLKYNVNYAEHFTFVDTFFGTCLFENKLIN